jgi:DNA-directed RNA polymerase specialized sigma24 family protein
MNKQDCLACRLENDRNRLRAVAYRMLGSLSEADDAVQEAWLRLSGSRPTRSRTYPGGYQLSSRECP